MCGSRRRHARARPSTHGLLRAVDPPDHGRRAPRGARMTPVRRRQDCGPSVLPLFQRELDDEALRAYVLAKDVVYAGGGNTANMPAVWRVHGMDRLLREAYDRGALLCGTSAGANCWAEASSTDSFGPLVNLHGGLGLLSGSVCPHYDVEPGRRPSYRAAVADGSLPGGWALDDGAAALVADGRLTETVSGAAGSHVYRVETDGRGGVREHVVPGRPLG
ncbi:Type 1 glutamine amidotransferase-like domain-containing protein [Streptomyces sp. NPDC101152]|uniref:Type 1 glutamine amidotransferase-like domain-containing protein n=1 Tax=Streptomyces sp. NPDC101152 TaxID=3366116 RepID=UPI00380D0D5B